MSRGTPQHFFCMHEQPSRAPGGGARMPTERAAQSTNSTRPTTLVQPHARVPACLGCVASSPASLLAGQHAERDTMRLRQLRSALLRDGATAPLELAGPPLRPYQAECVRTCLELYEAQGVRRQVVSLPVGTGKTVRTPSGPRAMACDRGPSELTGGGAGRPIRRAWVGRGRAGAHRARRSSRTCCATSGRQRRRRPRRWCWRTARNCWTRRHGALRWSTRTW